MQQTHGPQINSSVIILTLFHFSRCSRNTFISESNSSFERIFSHSFLATQVLNPSYQISVLDATICFQSFQLLPDPHPCSQPPAGPEARLPRCCCWRWGLPDAPSSSTDPPGRDGERQGFFFFLNLGLHLHGLLNLHSLTRDWTCVPTLEGKILMTGPLRKVLGKDLFFSLHQFSLSLPSSLLLVSWQKKPGETRCQP